MKKATIIFLIIISNQFISAQTTSARFEPFTYDQMRTASSAQGANRQRVATGEEPKNNLKSSLYELKQKFPALEFITTNEKGDQYSDGKPSDGIGVFFYVKNNIVVEEAMVVQSNDGFAMDYFKKVTTSFIQAGNYLGTNFSVNKNRFIYSYFYIDVLNYTLENKNTTFIAYSLR